MGMAYAGAAGVVSKAPLPLIPPTPQTEAAVWHVAGGGWWANERTVHRGADTPGDLGRPADRGEPGVDRGVGGMDADRLRAQPGRAVRAASDGLRRP